MLFLMGLLGLTAVGATMVMGSDEAETTKPEEDDAGAGEETEENIIDLGTIIQENGGSSAETDTGTLQGPLPDDDTQAYPNPGQWTIQQGGPGDDHITGTDGNEFLLGYGGDDLIHGNGGTDEIEGGEGNDTLFGGDGNDLMHGDDGDDDLMGDDGDDTLYGHSGDDLLQGDDGDDSMVGGQGDDTVEGGQGDDALHGYHGDDELRGGAGEDTLFGGIGNDILHGFTKMGEDDGVVDFLNGGEGDDTITAGANDVVTAGDGADTIQFGDWNADGGAVQVMDFEPEEDSLVVLYNDGGAEPDVSVEPDPENQNLYRIMADGEVIAEVRSEAAVTEDDIALVGRSAA